MAVAAEGRRTPASSRAEPADGRPRATAGRPHHAGHLRRHRRPGPAQTAAGALQPRPRRGAARATSTWSASRAGNRPDEDFRDECEEAIRRFSRRPPDEDVLEALLANVRYVPGTSTTTRSTSELSECSTASKRRPAKPLNRAFYLSTAPSFFPVIVEAARQTPSSTTTSRADVRVIIEKPFGTTPRRRRANSTDACCRSSKSPRSSASTTTWARRPSRTCWRSASPTACSSRCGTATTSTASRSPPPRTSASARAPSTTTTPGRCAT